MPEDNHCGAFDLIAINEKEERKWVASHVKDEDADFITAIHGCLPDLVRQLHEALDEADRLDRERDEQETRIFNLELQVDDLKGKLEWK